MLFSNNKTPELSENNESKIVKRLECSYENLSKRFIHARKDFSKQFAHIYAVRLSQMQDLIIKKVNSKWGNKYPIRQLCDLREEQQEKCVIIGTLFKHQELKPSILKEISEENKLVPQPPRFHFVDDADKLILEDELQRIRLVGNVDVHQIITGVVCAVLGYEEGDGRFYVEEFLFSEGCVHRPLSEQTPGAMLLLVSGISLASAVDVQLPLQLLGEWVSGMVGNNKSEVARIVRIVIVGNSIRSSSEVKQKSHSTRTAESDDTLEAVKGIDDILEGLCTSIPVDIMPGEFDPCNHMLPQQPLHPCLFPKGHSNGALMGVPNPYHFQLNGLSIVGSSGQPIHDVLRYTRIETPLDALRNTLVWGHMAPTAPDTLPCYPFYEKDPFILEEVPHIYFAGNCSEFQTELHSGSDGQRTRLICLPEFSTSQTAAVVDLNTMDCTPVCFSVHT